jgi:hypothetical protein
MASHSPAALAHGDDRDAVRDNRDVDHNFLPDFAFAAVGGVAALAACVLILMLTTSFSGGPPISAYTRELAGAFLAGFLVVLVARSLSTRTR